jgi:hypothetical protein
LAAAIEFEAKGSSAVFTKGLKLLVESVGLLQSFGTHGNAALSFKLNAAIQCGWLPLTNPLLETEGLMTVKV